MRIVFVAVFLFLSGMPPANAGRLDGALHEVNEALANPNANTLSGNSCGAINDVAQILDNTHAMLFCSEGSNAFLTQPEILPARIEKAQAQDELNRLTNALMHHLSPSPRPWFTRQSILGVGILTGTGLAFDYFIANDSPTCGALGAAGGAAMLAGTRPRVRYSTEPAHVLNIASNIRRCMGADMLRVPQLLRHAIHPFHLPQDFPAQSAIGVQAEFAQARILGLERAIRIWHTEGELTSILMGLGSREPATPEADGLPGLMALSDEMLAPHRTLSQAQLFFRGCHRIIEPVAILRPEPEPLPAHDAASVNRARLPVLGIGLPVIREVEAAPRSTNASGLQNSGVAAIGAALGSAVRGRLPGLGVLVPALPR